MAILIRLGLVALTLCVLVFDQLTPIGHADWLGYYVIIVLASFYVERKWLLRLAALSSVFTILGLHATELSPLVAYAIENRISSIVVLWVLTYALYRNSVLAESLRQRTDTLTLANRDMESFSYSVSHDLKNPLSAISAIAGILLDRLAGKVDESDREALAHLISESNRMSDLISDMLRLSRIGRQELKIEHANISDIAAESAEQQKRLLGGKQVVVSIQPEMIVPGDKGLLRVLFDNLIGNAVKFSAKTDKPRIEIGKCSINEEEVYFVRDNGVGFEMSKADRLFEPFTRLHSTKDFSGTGIGLSIVRKIIERHTGKIWAQSEVGKGATFFFTLRERNPGKIAVRLH